MGAITNAVAKQSTGTDIKSLITKYETQFGKAIPESCGLTPERFVRVALTAMTTNPKLASCSKQSLMGAMLNCSALGMTFNDSLGRAYLIPYGSDCQFQLSYKGLIELAYRSGNIDKIEAHAVHANDTFEVEYGTNEHIKFIPKLNGDRGEVYCYFAMYKTKIGGTSFEVMTKAEAEEHKRKYSKASRPDTPWNTAFDEMAKKTVLKKLLKTCSLEPSLAKAVNTDETVKSAIKVEDVVDTDSVLDIAPDEISVEGVVE